MTHEDWGKVQSLRVCYLDGLEVEFGITDRDWLREPLDSGTIGVLEQGWQRLFLRDEDLLNGVMSKWRQLC